MAAPIIGLVGDVGGTHARFAIARVEGHKVSFEASENLLAADYPRGLDAVRAFLDTCSAGQTPRFGVIAAAGPIHEGAVTFTNNTNWSFSERELAWYCDLKAVRLINDFAAQALAIDHLSAADLFRVGPAGAPQAHATAAVIGPGTGFGAGALVDDGSRRAVLTGEGGHIAFAPVDEIERDILARLAPKLGRVSIERLLSGPGLLSLYQTLAEIRGEPAPLAKPDEITRAGAAGDVLASAALHRFCAVLGSVAGDFALAYGARRGLYVSGGIAPSILDVMAASTFRERFEDKGRMSDYVRAIPTFVVTANNAALIGAASLLSSLTGR